MRRRDFIKAIGGGAVAWPFSARAQVGERKYTIGIFGAGSASSAGFSANSPFLKALQELGWVEGKNVVFEYRFAENRLEQLPELAADLVRHKVDVIAAAGTLAPLAAKRATTRIPILVPVVTAIFAFILFDERLDSISMLGMVICASGVALVNRRVSSSSNMADQSRSERSQASSPKSG